MKPQFAHDTRLKYRMRIYNSLYHHLVRAADRFTQWVDTHKTMTEEEAERVNSLFNRLLDIMRDFADLYHVCYDKYNQEMLKTLSIADANVTQHPTELEEK